MNKERAELKKQCAPTRLHAFAVIYGFFIPSMALSSSILWADRPPKALPAVGLMTNRCGSVKLHTDRLEMSRLASLAVSSLARSLGVKFIDLVTFTPQSTGEQAQTGRQKSGVLDRLGGNGLNSSEHPRRTGVFG